MRYSLTSAQQVFTVPAGTTAITAIATGATGGSAGGPGWGSPGTAQATIPVVAGDQFFLFVGGCGGVPGGPGSTLGGLGGYNGGGSGGPTAGQAGWSPGCGGGGGSDIRYGGNALSNRILIAAGGGGEASNTFEGGIFRYYGGVAGTGLTSVTGGFTANSIHAPGASDGPNAGNLTTNGAPGAAGLGGTAGSLGQGGTGGGNTVNQGPGGAGGGWYGGGGGNFASGGVNGSGGAAGSSFIASSYTRGSLTGMSITNPASGVAYQYGATLGVNGEIDIYWVHAPVVGALITGGPGLPCYASMPFPIGVSMSDPDNAEVLTRVDIRWRLQGGSTWTTISNAHTNTALSKGRTAVYVFPGGTFTGGTTIEVQAQVYNSALSGTQPSGWSASSFFAALPSSGTTFPIAPVGDQWPDNSVTPHTYSQADMVAKIDTPLNNAASFMSHWNGDFLPALDQQNDCGFQAVAGENSAPLSGVATVIFDLIKAISYSAYTYDANTGIYTIPKAGLYICTASVIQGTAAGIFSIALSGLPTGYTPYLSSAPSTFGGAHITNVPIRFAGGEQLKVLLAAGTGIIVTGGYSNFSAWRVGT